MTGEENNITGAGSDETVAEIIVTGAEIDIAGGPVSRHTSNIKYKLHKNH